ncbi:MAG TPA: hypothetical protein QF597_06605 [Arenicellales bacterium]|nr:hypothetical protein [Arenicellales bacterium]HJL57149.1 hypothetical protein [Arenicellales bacterium]
MALQHQCCLSEARPWGGGARLGEHDLLESRLRRFRHCAGHIILGRQAKQLLVISGDGYMTNIFHCHLPLDIAHAYPARSARTAFLS